MKTRAELRDEAYYWLEAAEEHPVPRRWRVVITDTESPSGYGPVCPQAGSHPLLDCDMGRDTDGVYDCCPHVVETFSESLAAYTVAVLNRDAHINPHTRQCPRKDRHPHHSHQDGDAADWDCPGRRYPL